MSGKHIREICIFSPIMTVDYRVGEALHHDSIADEYDDYWVNRVHYKFLADEMLDDLNSLGVGKDSLILDIGAGTGSTTLPLCSHFTRVLAGDISMRMIGKLRDKRSCASVLVCSADSLPVKPGALDVVVMSKALHHMSTDLRNCVLKGIRSALRSGGIFYIIEDNAPPEALSGAADAMKRHFSPDRYPSGKSTRTPWEHPIPHDELVSELEYYGFQLEVKEYTFYLPFNFINILAGKDEKLARAIWNAPRHIPLIKRLGGAVRLAARK